MPPVDNKESIKIDIAIHRHALFQKKNIKFFIWVKKIPVYLKNEIFMGHQMKQKNGIIQYTSKMISSMQSERI